MDLRKLIRKVTEQGAPPQGVDYVLLATVVGMVLFGLLMVYSSSFIYAQEKTNDGFSFIRKQVGFAALGFVVLAATCRIDYRKWSTWSYYVVGGAIVLLAMVLLPGVGTRVLGAQRWIRMGPLVFQPGEFAKFAVIFFVASQLARKHDRVHTFTAGVIAPFLVPLPALVLLLLQPDFGTTVMITIVIFSLMFLGGVPKRFLASVAVLGGTAGALLAFGTAYRRNRILGYLDPWADPGGKGFQIIQSWVGLHNGRFWGVGLGNGKEKLFYLPEAHNDFIFAVIGEELGFIGIAVVIAAFLYFIHRGLRIAYIAQRHHKDQFGMLLASGITLALGLQGFVNIAVVMGLLPTKGLTLPFISYGGSALLIDLFAVGVLLSIARGPQAYSVEGKLGSPTRLKEKSIARPT
jgi:cell division protein FtsW